MKKFHFPLAQAMEWRRTSLRLEESKLEALYAELAAINSRACRIRDAQALQEKTLAESIAVTGAELNRLDVFTQAAKLDLTRSHQASLDCQKRIAAQMNTVVQKRRDLILLERLHERKLAEWKADFARELDQEAEELHLAKFSARYP